MFVGRLDHTVIIPGKGGDWSLKVRGEAAAYWAEDIARGVLKARAWAQRAAVYDFRMGGAGDGNWYWVICKPTQETKARLCARCGGQGNYIVLYSPPEAQDCSQCAGTGYNNNNAAQPHEGE